MLHDHAHRRSASVESDGLAVIEPCETGKRNESTELCTKLLGLRHASTDRAYLHYDAPATTLTLRASTDYVRGNKHSLHMTSKTLTAP